MVDNVTAAEQCVTIQAWEKRREVVDEAVKTIIEGWTAQEELKELERIQRTLVQPDILRG